MTDHDQLNIENRLAARIAVHNADNAAAPTMVAFHSSGGDQIDITVNGPDLDKELIERSAKQAFSSNERESSADPETIIERIVESVSAALVAEGRSVDRVPVSDAEFKLEIDLRSGMMVGQHRELHAFGSPPADLGASILAAIQKGFQERADATARTLSEKVAAGDHVGAAQLATAGDPPLDMMIPSHDVLDVLLTIERASLQPDLRIQLQRVLVSLASSQGRDELGGAIAEELLQDDPSLDEQTRFGLRNMIGVAAIKRGETEYALALWNELVRDPALTDAAQRGWLWRNISMASGRSDSQALKAARNAIDAFLQAGDKRQAAISIRQLSNLQEEADPKQAIQSYDDMLRLMSASGVMDDEIRANIHHGRGRKLLELRDPAGALEAAREASRLRRGLLGVEEQLISSLHLARIAAEQLGDEEGVAALNAEARALEEQTQSPRFAFGRRVAALMEAFDPAEAAQLMAEAECLPDSELLAGAGVAIAISDPALTPLQRIGQLEALLRKLDQRKAGNGVRQPARLAIAVLLREQGNYKRAANWYRQLIAAHPLDLSLHELLVDTLWQAEDWGNAVIVLRERLDAFGEKPGVLFAYGKSLFEAGDLSGSVTALSKALGLAKEKPELEKLIRELRDRALDLGGTIIPDKPRTAAADSVAFDEVRQALQDFAQFVSSSKRMAFWQKKENGKERQWIARPENFGQTLLHTFLKARFGESVSVFEEIDAGAGRLDLLLQFAGGLSVIVELKMCGHSYSSTYAKSGEGQVQHYMKNRQTHLGFLVVFDARLRDYETPLLSGQIERQNTVAEIRIDVRPVVTPD